MSLLHDMACTTWSVRLGLYDLACTTWPVRLGLYDLVCTTWPVRRSRDFCRYCHWSCANCVSSTMSSVGTGERMDPFREYSTTDRRMRPGFVVCLMVKCPNQIVILNDKILSTRFLYTNVRTRGLSSKLLSFLSRKRRYCDFVYTILACSLNVLLSIKIPKYL